MYIYFSATYPFRPKTTLLNCERLYMKLVKFLFVFDVISGKIILLKPGNGRPQGSKTVNNAIQPVWRFGIGITKWNENEQKKLGTIARKT